MADRLSSVELWGTVECDGGSKIADLPLPFSATEEADLNGDHRVELVLDRTHASWASVAFERVLRLTFADGDVSEWRIREVEQARESSNARGGLVRADHIKYDLIHRSGLLERVEKNGTVWNHFEYYGLTPQQHADVIMHEAPDYFSVGSIASTERVDMIYHQDNPLSAFEELASVIGLELEVVRNGATDYKVNLVVKRGSTATPVVIQHAQNLLSQSRAERSDDMGTQIYPRGGQEYGDEGSMAHHAFRVGFQSGGTIVFEEEIFSENDQLNGKYVEDNAGNFIQINDVNAPKAMTLASGPNLSGDRRLRFRRKFTDPISGDTYGALTFLPSPSAIANYGIKPAILDRSDIPLIDNLVPNPMFVDWAGGIPEYITQLGSPAVTKNVDPLYTRHGEGSLHIVTNAVGQGVETHDFYVKPTEERPFFVAQIQLYVVSGHVRLELIDVTNNETFPPIGKDAATIAQETWIDSFGVAPGGTVEENFYTKGTQAMRIRVSQIGDDPADFYLDMLQCTQTATFRQVMYGGRASNDLWVLAKEALEIVQTPSAEYEVELIDLNRINPDEIFQNEIVLGGEVNLLDTGLDFDITTRILSYTKNLMIEGDTQIEVEGKSNDLSRILGQTERRIRKKLAGPYGEEGTTTGVDLNQEEDDYGGGDDDSINISGDDAEGKCASAEEEHCTPDSAGTLQLDPSPWDDIVLIEPVADDGPDATEWDGLAIAWSAEGKIEVTGEGAGEYGEVGQNGILKKTATGLVYRVGLFSTNLTVDDGAISFDKPTGQETWVKFDPQTCARITSGLSPRQKARLQVKLIQGSLSVGDELIGRVSGSGLSGIGGYAHRRKAFGYGGLYRVTSGPDAPLDEGIESGLDTSFRPGYLSLFYENGNQWAGDDGDPTFSAADTFFDGVSGTVGFRNLNTDQPSWYKDLIVTNGNVVRITGIPMGSGLTVSCAGVDHDVDTEAIADVLEFQLPAGTLLPVNTITVTDSGGAVVETISPASGIWDGDQFLYDPAGLFIGESSFDSQVVVDLEFYGMDYYADYPNWTYLSTAHGVPTRNTEYVAKSVYGQTTIPVGTMMIRPVLRRIGGAQAIACVRRLNITVGTRIPSWTPCELRFSGGGWAGQGRVPTDEGLLLYLPFDDYKLAKPNCDDYDADPGDPTHRVPDPDGTILLSRIEYDASVNQNHFALETLFWDAPDSVQAGSEGPFLPGFGNWLQPYPGVSGLGRIIPDWFIWDYGVTGGALYAIDPLPVESAPALQRWTKKVKLDVFEDFTIVFWYRAFLDSYIENCLISNFSTSNTTWTTWNWLPPPWGGSWKSEAGGFQIWVNAGWDILGSLRFRWMTHDSRSPWASYDCGSRSIYWNADPNWGECDTDNVPPGKERDDGRSMGSMWSFYAITVSAAYPGTNPETPDRTWEGMGMVQDITAYHGNSRTGIFRKLTDDDLYKPNDNYYFSSQMLPSILPFSDVDNGGASYRGGAHQNEMTRFTVFGADCNEAHIMGAQHDWDPASGAMDEVRMYNRVLSDAEIYGLFMVPGGQKPHTQAGSAILRSIAGAGAETTPYFNDQTEEDGVDPYAPIIISDEVI